MGQLDQPPQRIRARWAWVDDRVVDSCVITMMAGSIVAIEPDSRDPGDFEFEDSLALPGLVNAHTHLDLSGAAGLTPPQIDFCAWLISVIAYRRSRSHQQLMGDLQAGIRALLASGTTVVGDISAVGLAAAALDQSPLRHVCFHELIGLSESRCQAALDASRSFPAVSPHAPYSFRYSGLGRIPSHVPLAMHVAETREELELLKDHRGRFRAFLEELGVWDESGIAPDIDAVLAGLAGRVGPTLLIHCNYLAADANIPEGATVVYCPRTHTAFGHSAHPWREFRRRGANVVLGTDSLASNPDLSVLNEARFLFRSGDAPELLIPMITSLAATGLGLGSTNGRIRVGSRADLCVFPVMANGNSPLAELLGSDVAPVAVFVAGRRIT